MFRFLFIILLFLMVFLAATPAGLLLSAVQDTPLVPNPNIPPTPEDVERLKQWVKASNPLQSETGEIHTHRLDQRDLNFGLRSFLPLAERQNTHVSVSMGEAVAEFSMRLPENSLGGYINIRAHVVEENSQPVFHSLRFGDREIPSSILRPMQWSTEQLLSSLYPEYDAFREALQEVKFLPQELTLTYRWDKQLASDIEERGRALFVSPEDRERMLAYYQTLSAVSYENGTKAPLTTLLRELFNVAKIRSMDGDADAENRALLMVMGTVLNRSTVLRLVGGDEFDLGKPHRYVEWTLQGDEDLALHFGISAAIAVTSTTGIADAAGVLREYSDAAAGSGFSFVDLLADRSGVAFALAATGSDGAALQEFMSRESLAESDFMPRPEQLSKDMTSLVFQERYRDLDDSEYGAVKREVDERIKSLRVLQL